MTRDTRIQLIAAGIMISLLAASAGLTTAVAASVGRNRLVYTDTIDDKASSQVALGIAMGAFRGLFVNWLWIRANDLKEAGKYYEAVDLASTITKLQPRFPRVWAFHAWNLAYNISVATNTPQERWQWVQAGIRLLRDEGIPANPNDLLIHKELAWIHLHKIQGVMDDANHYYKRAFAREWTIVMGPAPGRSTQGRTDEQAIEDHVQWVQRIAEAKPTLAEVAALSPKHAELIERLRTEAGLNPADLRPASREGALAILELVEEQRSLQRIYLAVQMIGQRPDANVAFLNLFHDPEYGSAFQDLVRHLRRRVLEDIYRMEPERMIRYTRKFGPLDWRHASAHAVYWSARGVEQSLLRVNEKNKKDFDFVNTDRITIQAIQDLYRSGDLTFDLVNPDFYIQLPNPHFIAVYAGILEELRARSPFDATTKVYTMYSAGYENFLRDVIRFLYRRGDTAGAEKYHKTLREFRYLNDNNPDVIRQLSLPLDEFVKEEITRDDRFTSPEVARTEVMGSLFSAYIRGLLTGEMKLFNSEIDYARTFHELYRRRQIFSTGVNEGDRARLEVMDRDFETFAARILVGCILDAGPVDGSIMYARAPLWLQQKAWPMLATTALRTQLDASAEANPDANTFNIWFPPPPGVDPNQPATPGRRRSDQVPAGGLEVK